MCEFGSSHVVITLYDKLRLVWSRVWLCQIQQGNTTGRVGLHNGGSQSWTTQWRLTECVCCRWCDSMGSAAPWSPCVVWTRAAASWPVQHLWTRMQSWSARLYFSLNIHILPFVLTFLALQWNQNVLSIWLLLLRNCSQIRPSSSTFHCSQASEYAWSYPCNTLQYVQGRGDEYSRGGTPPKCTLGLVYRYMASFWM